MEKAIHSHHFITLKGLLDKAYRGDVSEELQQVVEYYIKDACEKMKRIIDVLFVVLQKNKKEESYDDSK